MLNLIDEIVACLFNINTRGLGYSKTDLIEIVSVFVAGGAALNSIDSVRRTPLSILCDKYGNENLIDIIQILLVDGGADPNLYGVGEFTSLYYLCRNYKRDNLVDIIQLFNFSSMPK